MRDELRGPTPRPIRREPTGPVALPDATTRRIETPAEISTVQEIVEASMPLVANGVGKVVATTIAAAFAEFFPPPHHSGDSVVMSRAKRTGYRGTIGGLVVALALAIFWGASKVQAYGDDRESAARSAIAAEAKAAEAAEYAEQTRQIAEGAADRAGVIETKLDRVLAKLDAMEGR